MVSIVIPVYNETPWKLSQAIMSILCQTYEGDIEIIVVDDGSDSKDRLNYQVIIDNLQPWTSDIPNRFVKLFVKENGGTASALNYGIEKANGDIIGWLSSDDMFFLEKIQLQVKMLSDGMWSFTGFVNQESGNLHYYAGKDFFGKMCDLENNESMSTAIVDHFPGSCFINGCSVMYRRSFLDKVGMFDENLKLTQDYDMWLRMAYAEEPFLILQPLVIHREPTRDYPDREEIKKKEFELIAQKMKQYMVGEFNANK